MGQFTDDRGKKKSMANKQGSRVTWADKREPSLGWYFGVCQLWKSHNNKRVLFWSCFCCSELPKRVLFCWLYNLTGVRLLHMDSGVACVVLFVTAGFRF
jgi:hypothetical protein